MATKDKKKFAEAFDTEDELEKGYTELLAKFRERDAEIGNLRQHGETSNATLQAYKDWEAKVVPVMQWVEQNRQGLEAYEQSVTNPQPAPQPAAQFQAAGTGILTTEEHNAIVNAAVEAAVSRNQQQMAEWTQRFGSTAEDLFNRRDKEARDANLNAVRANQDVMWQTMEHIFPKEQIDRAREFHEEGLKYSNPDNIKPLEMAKAHIAMRTKMADIEKERDEYKEQSEQAARNYATPTGRDGLSAAFGLGDAAIESASKDASDNADLYEAVMKDVEAKHGTRQVQTLANR